MKILFLVGFLIATVTAEEKYTSKYDSIDYHSILASERLLKHYYDCLMDAGPCTPDGKELKSVISDALETECTKCTEKQKDGAKEVIEYMVKNKVDWWKNLMNKYDPDGIYKEKYQDEWRKLGYPFLIKDKGLKMGYLSLIFLLAVASCGALAQTYNTRYDNIDIDQILSNKRVLDNYIKCILDDETRRCSPEGREFKKYIPEAIRTNCAKCSDAQKRITKKASIYIMQHRPQDWDKIRKKFDPQGKYQDSFAAFLKSVA
ncbi:uncharacterized protein LOC114335173 [Diabrotica virgifera virgifera]|uniref:Ejaculatory bulb-specific protein 3-like n=3 Tax=Diabrotica virgifera virgifera TaxID=50390 RepID=A0ABM5IT57_DIAVI|nr:uncharacterized protein LOC114335173 [Diabrotica virgifera virgifera]